MFLEALSQYGLLVQDPESDILEAFPPMVRRILISEVTGFLLNCDEPNLLSSPSHVKWVMEVVGAGFALPLEEAELIKNSIDIYQRWLREDKAPQALLEQKQLFWQRMFHHMSLLFQRRDRKVSIIPSSSSSTTSLPAVPHKGAALLANQYLHKHVELCRRVLDIFTWAGRSGQLDEESWTVLLKVMLGVVDAIVSEPVGTSSDNMPRYLCPILLKTLIELWLRSKIRVIKMWDYLKTLFKRWTHRSDTIEQWSSTAFGLTNRVVRILYEGNEGTPNVVIRRENLVDESLTISLDLPDDFVYYAWHQFLYVVDDPAAFRQDNFYIAFQGLNKITDIFLSVGTGHHALDPHQLPSVSTVPDGNTLLHMFGNWLFEAAMVKSEGGFEIGKAVAFETLCKIFASPQRRNPFLNTYLERFYAVLAEGLKSDLQSLSSIVTKGENLFITQIEGIKLLFPDFVLALRRILDVPVKTLTPKIRIPESELRKSALKILSSVISLPNHFSDIPIRSGISPADVKFETVCTGPFVEQISKLFETQIEKKFTFLQLKPHILNILMNAMYHEVDSENALYILHLLQTIVIEDCRFSPGLPAFCVAVIQDKLVQPNLWPEDVQLYAFKVITSFTRMYKQIEETSPSRVKSLVMALCEYINVFLNAPNFLDYVVRIGAAVDCIVKWILAGQWILSDQDCLSTVLKTIGINLVKAEKTDDALPVKLQGASLKPPKKFPYHGSIKGKKKGFVGLIQQKYVSSLKEISEIAMAKILSLLGNYPSPAGPTRMSTLWNERKAIKEIHDKFGQTGAKLKFMRYFILDGRTIFGFLEEPDAAAPSFTLSVRNPMGAFSFSFTIKYLPDSKIAEPLPSAPADSSSEAVSLTLSEPPAESPSEDSSSLRNITCHNADRIPTISETLKDAEKQKELENANRITQEFIRKQLRLVELFKKSPAFLDKYPVLPPIRTNMYDGPCGFQAARIFLSQLGFLSVENRDKIFAVSCNSYSNSNTSFFESLDTLDAIPERECATISVLFLPSAKKKVEDFLLGDDFNKISNDFMEFVRSLGWPVDIATHQGFRGSLTEALCKTAPYYTDLSNEIIFHVPCLIKPRFPSFSAPPRSQSFLPPDFPFDRESFSSFSPSGLPLPSSSSPSPSFPSSAPQSASGTPSSVAPPTASSSSPAPLPPATSSSSLPASTSSSTSSSPSTSSAPNSFPPLPSSSSLSFASAHHPPPSPPPSVHQVPFPPSPLPPSTSSQVHSIPFPSLETREREVKTEMTIKELLERNFVQIVWIEELMDYIQVTKSLGGQSMVYLFINPLVHSPGQYRIRLYCKQKRTPLEFGPLTDGMVVSRARLGELVRITAISAHFWCESLLKIRKDPYLERRKQIEIIQNEFKRPDSQLWKFYAEMFGEA